MKIKVTTIYVDDQSKALNFYTEVLGLKKSKDVSNHGYRWVTVVSPEDPDGTELQLESNANQAARAFQESKFKQSQPAVMFFVDDVQAEHDRLKARGAKFTVPPTKVTGSTIAMLDDTCGNIVQITALDRH
jgi:predicted enzyme related to lactoylglutathione lyase